MYSSLATLEFIHRAILLDIDSAPTIQCERNIIGTKVGEWIRPKQVLIGFLDYKSNQIYFVLNHHHLSQVIKSIVNARVEYLIKIKVKYKINI